MDQFVNVSETWYESTAERGPPRAPLTGEVEADVCVVGGGFAGLTCALELARRGKRVVLLEAKRLAWGASGRNGGFVASGFAERIDNVAARVGLGAAQALYNLSRQGTEYMRREIANADPSIKMGDGILKVVRYENAAGLMAQRDVMARDYGEDLEFLDTEATRARLNSYRYYQALHNQRSFHIHPLRYSLIIAHLAEAAGATLHENSPALEVVKSAGGWLVRTKQGRVAAAHVIHCVSSLDRSIHRATGRAVLPVATYVAVTEPLLQDAIRTGSAAADTRRASNYYRLIDGGRILWGGAITTRVSEPSRLAQRMKGDMLSVFPQLGNPRIGYAWAGLMGYALHKMPLIGRDHDGQWYATAFGGHGLNTTAMAGLLIARAIAEGDDEYRRFEAFAPRWAGGPFGRIGVQTYYWWMRLRDRIDEAPA
jgi:gamma-glutamylputrescine oxidase